MTLSDSPQASAATEPAPPHPLAPLHASEIDAFRQTAEAAGLSTESTRYAYLSLREPSKSALKNDPEGLLLPRIATGLVVNLSTASSHELTIDLTHGVLLESKPVTDATGPTFDEEFDIVDSIVKSDQRWIQALTKRGVTDLDSVRVVALSAGVFGYDDEIGVRVARALSFVSTYPTDSVWAHPIDGVVAHVDLTNRKVLRVVETDILHVPTESGDYLDPNVRGPERTSLKPIAITQPEGVSFQLDGDHLTWENWSLRLGFNGREGLTLHQLGFHDQGRLRSIIHRASVSEMVVPYGDPTPTHDWQNYFDVGEYQFGRTANSLELGCDCVGEIVYKDAVVADDLGQPRVIKNAICLHEEDYGVLWKHTDVFSGSQETRRQRRLVISFFVTIGNYDYGFYWYLYLDGGIQLEAKATGIVFTSGHPGGDYPFATELAPGLGAPVHQHLFSARLDMAVDGEVNAVDEIDVQRVPTSESNPRGNAFTRTSTRLRTEGEAQRLADRNLGRTWAITNPEKLNRMGRPVSYVLYPEGNPTLLAADDSSIRARAAFATKHLWVTQFEEGELWAAGSVVAQHAGGAGLPAYAAADRSIDGADIVLWHTFGLTHFPRLEDWPIMPVDYAGFTMKPDGFFDRNPTLDVPASTSGHCVAAPCTPDAGCHC